MLLKIALLTLLAGLVLFVSLGIYSHFKPANVGLEQGRLKPCQFSTNCVCSEEADSDVSPLEGKLEDQSRLIQLLQQSGGNLIQQQPGYVHVTFSSRIFRFVDDVELRYDAGQASWHIRSASRVGRDDMGVNRKRVEALRRSLKSAG